MGKRQKFLEDMKENTLLKISLLHGGKGKVFPLEAWLWPRGCLEE